MEQRFAQGAGFFGAVHYGNSLDGSRDDFNEIFNREGAEQFNFEHTHFFALHGFHGVLCYVRAGTHNHNQAFRIGITDVLEELIVAAGDFFKLGHFFLHNTGHGVVKFVDGFARLEVHIRVGGGTAHRRVFGVEPAGFMFFHQFVVNHFVHLFFGQRFHHVQLVAGAETVKEVHKRHARSERRGLGDKRHIHGFLRVVGAEHGPTGLADGHDIGMVAEDGQSGRGDSARRHVEHGGRQFAGDFVHIRNHQKQSLGGGKGGGQCAGG